MNPHPTRRDLDAMDGPPTAVPAPSARAPYYQDDRVTLYLGDCREITEWLCAKVLFADPPYGRNWRQGTSKAKSIRDDRHRGIAGDLDTSVRDAALALWGPRRAIVFGDLMLPPPAGTQQVAIYRKPSNAGTRGATAQTRRDVEAIYLLGGWPSGINGGRSSVFGTASWTGGLSSPQGRYGHPHVKPTDMEEELLDHLLRNERTTIAVPFAGTGSEAIAARNLGHRVIAVELTEQGCEETARRLSADVLDLGQAML